ncbi:uncharacterized protein LOC117174049 isoform X2 [Belonocnema kinseyi]|uniref:uncharacterized protein LOC117174049 isoform X2 n=1 Tax=Belonocnema kinseyi TaxID=2817044 RepID=UPI00143D14BC|nr:uncharacterized protein LOC117174049 isoform X2 [Belonocnema kinseyi]
MCKNRRVYLRREMSNSRVRGMVEGERKLKAHPQRIFQPHFVAARLKFGAKFIRTSPAIFTETTW